MKELEDMIKRLGDFPPTLVTAAAKAGATVALKAAKRNAPEDSGDLKKGLKLAGERKKGHKKVYQVGLDPKMNDVFVTMSKSGKRGYYPAAIEYGYIRKDGKKVAGAYYLKRALTENKERVELATLEGLIAKVDKELKKKW
ncbi:MAG: HK97 gp10 family phage protein [Dethiosulfatibacter sp.]|nr:HK97 gp10 family phage protein [Dethiosulfatibacter sp.]